MNKWAKRLGLTTLVAVPLVVGSWLALRDTTLPANNLYVERREREEKEDFRRWIEEYRTGVKSERKVTLDEMIEHLGYVHKRSNVATLDETQLVCFGEIHKLCGNEEAYILGDKFVGKNDKILVEESPPFVFDFPAEENKLLEAKIEMGRSEEQVQSSQKTGDPLFGAAQGIIDMARRVEKSFDKFEKISDYLGLARKNIDLCLSKDGEEDSFFSALARDNKGIVIGADADRRTKNGHLYMAVESSFLPLYSAAIEHDQEPHEFLKWLSYEATRAVKPTDSKEDKIRDIAGYLARLPTSSEQMEKRDEQIRANTVREVLSSRKGQRTFYIFGSEHLNNRLFEALENEGIRYVAFVPLEDKVARDNPSVKDLDPAELGKLHNFNYFIETILPWYVDERVKDGAVPYSGKFDGLFK